MMIPYSPRVPRAKIYRIPISTSAITSLISRPKTVTLSPKGIRANMESAVTKEIIGAITKTALSALSGMMSSLTKDLMPSAMGWSSPKYPTRFGPSLTCM